MDELIKRAGDKPSVDEGEEPVDSQVRDEEVENAGKKKVILEERGKGTERDGNQEKVDNDPESAEPEEEEKEEAIKRFEQKKKEQAKEMLKNISGSEEQIETSRDRFRKLKKEKRDKVMENKLQEDEGENEGEQEPETLKEKYDRYGEEAILH